MNPKNANIANLPVDDQNLIGFIIRHVIEQFD